MIKGISKKVIIIKNPDSDIFEEAYFIVKNTKSIFKMPKENDMVSEANRLITEYHKQQKLKLENQGQSRSDDNISAKKPEKSEISGINTISDINAIGREESAEYKKNKEKKDIDIKKSLSSIKDDSFLSVHNFTNPPHNGFSVVNASAIGNTNINTRKNSKSTEDFKKDLKAAFEILGMKGIKFKKFDISLKSFLYGIGFMSAIVIVFKIVEMLL